MIIIETKHRSGVNRRLPEEGFQERKRTGNKLQPTLTVRISKTMLQNGGVRIHPCPHDNEKLPKKGQLRIFLYEFVVCHRWFNFFIHFNKQTNTFFSV